MHWVNFWAMIETDECTFMHTEAVKAGTKAAVIACVASAVPIVSLFIVNEAINQHRNYIFNSN